VKNASGRDAAMAGGAASRRSARALLRQRAWEYVGGFENPIRFFALSAHGESAARSSRFSSTPLDLSPRWRGHALAVRLVRNGAEGCPA